MHIDAVHRIAMHHHGILCDTWHVIQTDDETSIIFTMMHSICRFYIILSSYMHIYHFNIHIAL